MRTRLPLVFFLVIFSFSMRALAAEPCLVAAPIQDTIGAATLDLIERLEEEAERQNCSGYLLRVNTPGGNLQTTKMIVQKILASRKPYLCLIAPRGAQAGSAGAMIMQACHLTGALPTTNIGAATPVAGSGGEMGEDLKKKILNDTISWIEGVAKDRGRSVKFARDMVEKATSVSAEEAVKIGGVDLLVDSETEFLEKARGRKIVLSKEVEVTLAETLAIVEFPLDLRYQVLSKISDPNISYLLFMGSLGLLYFGITNPGTVIPEVLGSIGLILAFVSFHMLDVYWGGVALILLGLSMFFLELFIMSSGVLAVGGLVAFFLGSTLLFDVQETGYSLSYTMILPVTLTLAALLGGILYFAIATRGRKSHSQILDDVSGVVLPVQSFDGREFGHTRWRGEIWRFRLEDEVTKEISLAPPEKLDQVVGVRVEGLTLIVKRTPHS